MERRLLLRPITDPNKKKKPLARVLRKQFPIHHKKFMFVHSKRNETHVDQEFSYTDEGFAKFIDVLGPVPEQLKTPSLGRRDHTKGYSENNLVWQDWVHNQAEAHFRVRWLLPLGFNTWSELLVHLKNI